MEEEHLPLNMSKASLLHPRTLIFVVRFCFCFIYICGEKGKKKKACDCPKAMSSSVFLWPVDQDCRK